MAGIHPEEECGVLCLEKLVGDKEWLNKYSNLNLIIVPCRNSFAFSIKKCFQDGVLNGTIIYSDDLCFICKYQNEYIVIPKLQMASQIPREELSNKLKGILTSNKISGFVHIISMRRAKEIRACTFFFNRGVLYDINDIKNIPKRNYLIDVNEIILKYHPSLIIDLHEGKGNKAYVYVDGDDNQSISMGKYVVSSFENKNITVKMNSDDRKRLSDGVFDIQDLIIWRSWKEHVDDSKIILIEAGIDNSETTRIEALKLGVEKCLEFAMECWGTHDTV